MLRVLIAAGSSYTRMVLQDIVGAAQEVRELRLVADSDTLLRDLKAEKPDVVVLDHDLPCNANGRALKRLFSEVPVPVLLLLHQEQFDLNLVREAVELGVYAVVLKPKRNRLYNDYRKVAQEVLQKLLLVHSSMTFAPQERFRELQLQANLLQGGASSSTGSTTADTVVVIGASTGGTKAVEQIITQLTPDLPATVLIALHLPQNFTGAYAKRLQTLTTLKVVEGRKGLKLRPGKIIVAPGGQNMVVQPVMGNKANLMISFTEEQTVLFDQPSIDLLMRSVAQSTVKRVVGVILTGMGKDGTDGAASIKARGGFMLAQDEASSTIYGMAKSAVESGNIHEVLPLAEIPGFLNKYVAGQHVRTTDGKYEIERTGV